MYKYLVLISAIFNINLLGASISDANDQIITNVLNYGKAGSFGLGYVFLQLQSSYFANIFLGLITLLPLVFLTHYLIIGPKKFSHDKKKVYLFSIFNRIVHVLAAISFTLLIPTGFIMMFGSTFGGGEFVRVCQYIHVIATPIFIVSIIPMLIMWFKSMLFTSDDIKWLMIVGGYLSKEKKPVPAGKFNAGQKMWFWVCTVGGIFMILTGGVLYFLDAPTSLIVYLPLTKIEIFRISILAHNIVGVGILSLFITHMYMSIFAIKGAVQSVVTGYKEEEEIEILHSSFYKELKQNNKI